MNQKLINTEALRRNPCLDEQKLSFACLDQNGYDKDKCEAYFDNYKTCKKFWGKVYSDRRARNIKPYLPEPEDRPQVKAEYINQGKFV